MATTAEGVETQGQLDAIRTEGCSEMQGFLFSEALPPHEVDELLAAKHMQRSDKAAASAA